MNCHECQSKLKVGDLTITCRCGYNIHEKCYTPTQSYSLCPTCNTRGTLYTNKVFASDIARNWICCSISNKKSISS